MTRIVAFLVAVSRLATGIAFSVLIFSVLVQVFGRTFSDSPVWTEELTRFALLFLAACGVGLSFRTGDLVNVDIVSEALPGRGPWVLRLIAALATAGLCLMLLGPAWMFTSIGVLQTSPALGWRMDFIHVSVLVMVASLLIFSVLRVINMVLGLTDGRPEHPFGGSE